MGVPESMGVPQGMGHPRRVVRVPWSRRGCLKLCGCPGRTWACRQAIGVFLELWWCPRGVMMCYSSTGISREQRCPKSVVYP